MMENVMDKESNGKFEKIGAPGIYDVPAEIYHGDLCVGPSLSSSGARELMDSCPARYWWNSYLNPEQPVEEEAKFDLGTAAHSALLEPATMVDRIVVVDAADWRKKDAQEARAAARIAGKTPLLTHQYAEVCAMRDVMLSHPVAGKLWTAGKAEETFVWRDALTEVWLKARTDFRSDRRVIDYKSTTRAEREAFSRRVYDHGYYQQGAWNLDGVSAVTGEEPAEFILVAQEVEAPYLVSVFKLGKRASQWGRLLNRRAIATFAECLSTGVWPGYGDRMEEIELPGFAETQLEMRHEAGAFEIRRSA